MKISLLFPYDTPSKKNTKKVSCAGSVPRIYYSKKYTDWAKALQLPTPPDDITGDAECVVIRFWRETWRVADMTNLSESIMDILVDTGYLNDDSIFCVPQIELLFGGVDKENPRAEVDIFYKTGEYAVVPSDKYKKKHPVISYPLPDDCGDNLFAEDK